MENIDSSFGCLCVRSAWGELPPKDASCWSNYIQRQIKLPMHQLGAMFYQAARSALYLQKTGKMKWDNERVIDLVEKMQSIACVDLLCPWVDESFIIPETAARQIIISAIAQFGPESKELSEWLHKIKVTPELMKTALDVHIFIEHQSDENDSVVTKVNDVLFEFLCQGSVENLTWEEAVIIAETWAISHLEMLSNDILQAVVEITACLLKWDNISLEWCKKETALYRKEKNINVPSISASRLFFIYDILKFNKPEYILWTFKFLKASAKLYNEALVCAVDEARFEWFGPAGLCAMALITFRDFNWGRVNRLIGLDQWNRMKRLVYDLVKKPYRKERNFLAEIDSIVQLVYVCSQLFQKVSRSNRMPFCSFRVFSSHIIQKDVLNEVIHNYKYCQEYNIKEVMDEKDLTYAPEPEFLECCYHLINFT